MTKKSTIKITLGFLFFGSFFVFLFFVPLQVNSQGFPLEVKYPEIGGQRIQFRNVPIGNYVKYVFMFVIAISGILALFSLIWAGTKYITSAGDPEKLSKARKQILATFLGILIILGSYFFLQSINPQLLTLEISTSTVPSPQFPSPLPPPFPEVPDTITRMMEITKRIYLLAHNISCTVDIIKCLIDRCSCEHTQSVCLCKKYRHGNCEPLFCRIGKDSHPCPEWEKIEKARQDLIAFKKEIVYYRNWLEAESEDLDLEIQQIIEKIEYYSQRIEEEKEKLSEIPSEEEIARKNKEELIKFLEKKKEELELELSTKSNFNDFAYLLIRQIDELSEMISQFGEVEKSLIDSCWQRVKDTCQPRCEGGCHNTPGCFPLNCINATSNAPCLFEEINQAYSTIKNLTTQIDHISQIICMAYNNLHPPRPCILPLIPPCTLPPECGLPPPPPPPPPPRPSSCEASGGTCFPKEQGCPQNYTQSTLRCTDPNQICCIPKTEGQCQCCPCQWQRRQPCPCASAVPPGCVDLRTYGIQVKSPGANPYGDPLMAQKLVKFKQCLSREGITGWRVTEACPPTGGHSSTCHYLDGKCVDVDSAVLCQHQNITIKCILEAGFSGYKNECSGRGPHFHIKY